MSSANYAHCEGCERKAFYAGEEDIPEGVVIWHEECLRGRPGVIPDWADTIGDTELIAFVKARLAEDEAAASAVFDAAKLARADAPQRSLVLGHQVFDGTGIVVTHDRSVVLPSDVAAFIARYDPARAMREVEAKHRHLDQYRMAVAACQLAPADEGRGLESYRAAAWGAVLSDAAVWSDHADYLAKWKP